MIKQSSGIALCLKYVANKTPSVAPLVVSRIHVAVCITSKLSAKYPFSKECHGPNGISSYPVIHQKSLESIQDQIKFVRYNCAPDPIRHSSFLVCDDKDFNSSCKPNVTQQSALHCQCNCRALNLSPLGFPYVRTFNHLDFNAICDFKTPLNQKRDVKTNWQLLKARNLKSTHQIGQENSSQLNTQPGDPFSPPSEEQLAEVHKTLAHDLPRFFAEGISYKIYHPNIVLEDNIRGKSFSGLDQYNLQAKLLYIGGHIRFMYIKFDVMKITSHPEDGTIKVRWRITILKFRKLWRIKLWNISSSLQDIKESWLDGFSTYYVMGDGLVHKHVADKIIPDADQMLKKVEPKSVPVANPLAYAEREKV